MQGSDYSRLELNELKSRLDTLEKHVAKIEELEKSLLFHETLLTRKLTDLHALDGKVKNLVHQEHLKHIMKSVAKIESHEAILFDNATRIKSIFADLEKMKKSHTSAQQLHEGKLEAHRKEISQSDKDLKTQMTSKMKHLEVSMSDRLSQIEYQNKLIMKYLKKIDERIFNK